MKKLVNVLRTPAIAAGVFGLLLASGTANANFSDVKFYAGAGVDYNNYGLGDGVKNFKTHKTNGMALGIPVLGVKFNENFGMELGYSFNKKFKMADTRTVAGTTYNTNFDIKTRNSYLDLMGFMPLGDQFELVGGIGLGRLRVKPSNLSVTAAPVAPGSTMTLATKSKTSWRVKLGAQYNFNNNLGIRALATYQHVGNNISATVSGPNPYKTGDQKFVKNMKSIGLSAIYTF